MRKSVINFLAAVALTASLSSCGDKFLEDTPLYSGVDTETALDNVDAIGYALNGTYYQLERYYFAGNYSTLIGDIASDISYWNTQAGHFNTIYTFGFAETDNYLYYIWNYGYKVVDNAARVIEASNKLIPNATGNDEAYLKVYTAEASCLRAYANLVMANVFCHQAMVNGTSYLSQPGLVLVEEPIEAYANVERASLKDTYDFIISDLTNAIALFSEVGDQGTPQYFNLAAAYGLLARANMYLENWNDAAKAAEAAIQVSGIDELAYTPDAYAALYSTGTSNWESLFMLGIDDITNWSANSAGTLFSTYGYSYSPYLWSLYEEDDVRTSIMYWTNGGNAYYENQVDPDDDATPLFDGNFSGGKFYYGGGNAACANNFLINAPEMFLIQAEAYANLNQTSNAQEALLVVAMRNPEFTSVSDLPASKGDLLNFIKEERARELFQEGFRLWDLRRWGETANLQAINAPEIDWLIKNADCGKIVFPIPVDEINAGFGVTQNEGWAASLPK